MFERFFKEIAPKAFLADGSSIGEIQLLSTAGFKAKMHVHLSSSSLPTSTLEVKRVLSDTLMVVGPIGANIDSRADISGYLVSDGAAISSIKQSRPTIPLQDISRVVYEEEPTVALRVLAVDQFGNPVDFSGSIFFGFTNIDGGKANSEYGGVPILDGGGSI